MILVAVRSVNDAGAELLDSSTQALLEQYQAVVLADSPEVIVSVPTARYAFDLAYRWRETNPHVAVVAGAVGPLDVSARAARLRSILSLVTQSMMMVVGDLNTVLAPVVTDLEARDLGVHVFADLLPPEQVFAYVQPGSTEAQASFDGLTLIDHNLPCVFDSFVGRDRELGELADRVMAHPLVTMTGCGGTGKTRLVLHTAAQVALRGMPIVRFIRLADLPKNGDVGERIAEQAGFRSGRLADFINAYRQHRLLLIVDNCEHVTQSAREAVQQIVDEMPHVRVVATSRNLLGVASEERYEVGTLDLPEDEDETWSDHWQNFGALQMLNDRLAERNEENRGLDADSLDVARTICTRIDGLPLAIEHVAGQASVLGLMECARLLANRFDLLVSDRDDIEPRHKTIQAAIDWSYDLLSDAERRLFENLAVFNGSFAMEDAEEVCADEELPQYEIRPLLTSLVRKSLVTRIHGRDSRVRFLLLETVREYAALKSADRLDDLNERWFERAAFIVDEGYRHAGKEETQYTFADVTAAYGSIVGILKWGVHRGIPGINATAAQMVRYWSVFGPFSDGLAILESLQPSDQIVPREADLPVCNGLGVMLWLSGNLDSALEVMRITADEARRRGDLAQAALAFSNIANIALVKGDFEGAAPMCREAADLFLELKDYYRAGTALINLGFQRARVGQIDEGISVINEFIDEHGMDISHELLLLMRLNLADLQITGTRYAEARQYLQSIFEEASGGEVKTVFTPGLLLAALMCARTDQAEPAARFLGMAEQAFAELGGGQFSNRDKFLSEVKDYVEKALPEEERNRFYSAGSIVLEGHRPRTAILLLNTLKV